MDIRRATADIRYLNAVLPAAEREASRLGDEVPGLEHLVLAAAEVPDDDTARVALEAVGLSAAVLRDAVGRVHSEALAAVGITGRTDPVPAPTKRLHTSTGAAQEAFQSAVALAKAQGSRVRGAHLVLAATAQETGTFARALALLAVRPEALAAAARTALGGAAT